MDTSKLKLEYVPIADVPTGRKVREAVWDGIFSKIPRGQALVLREPEVSSSSVRAALSIRQKKGKFKNLQMTTRGKRGAVATYIMNVEKPSETVVRKAKPTVEG